VRRHPDFLAASFLAYPLLLSCHSAASGTVQIITGEETDTFTQTPVPTKLVVQAEDSTTYDKTTLATVDYPTDTIDLGNQDQDAVASLLVTGTAAGGTEIVVYGASIPVQYGALDGDTLPIFVQRVGQNARLPNPPADIRQAPTLAVLSDRFLIIGGGSDPTKSLTTQVYDFAQFSLLDPAPILPIVPASMPIVGTVALLLDAAGHGSYYDFSQDTAESVTAPVDTTNGFTFADVAGGQTLYDDTDGYVFVVGATRTTAPATAAVLMINPNDTSNADYPNGNLTWLSLTAPRLGASAAWVGARGLVVAGGNGGAMVSGVEILAVSASTVGTGLPFPPDASSGSGMTALNQQFVLIAGGLTPSGADAGVREVDLACDVSCAPVPWGTPGSGALPLAVTAVSAFTFDAAHAFMVGSEPMSSATPGLTHTFTLTSAGAIEVPTKVAHTNASAILSPMQSSVLVFGGANGGEIESFTPAQP
jgi:hypothetical protein